MWRIACITNTILCPGMRLIVLATLLKPVIRIPIGLLVPGSLVGIKTRLICTNTSQPLDSLDA